MPPPPIPPGPIPKPIARPSEIPLSVLFTNAEKKARYRALARRNCTLEPEDGGKRRCKVGETGLVGKGEWLMSGGIVGGQGKMVGQKEKKDVQKVGDGKKIEDGDGKDGVAKDADGKDGKPTAEQTTGQESTPTPKPDPTEQEQKPKVIASFTYPPQPSSAGPSATESPSPTTQCHNRTCTPNLKPSRLCSLAGNTATHILEFIFNPLLNYTPDIIEYSPAQIARNTPVYIEARIIEYTSQLGSSVNVVVLLCVKPKIAASTKHNTKDAAQDGTEDANDTPESNKLVLTACAKRVREVRRIEGVRGVEEVYGAEIRECLAMVGGEMGRMG